VQPEEISDDDLEESDRELSEERGTGGSRDGSLDGRRGGTGIAPAPPPPPPPPAPPPAPRGPIMRPENAIGGDMIGGMPPIEYPEAARSSGVSGMVIVKCVITLAGEPDDCTVLRGNPLLDAAAVANVRARRFTPVRLPDGTAIQVWKIFPVRFQLTNI
jgi:TonB family protein